MGEFEKEGAAVTFKKGFGYHPLGVWCDNTQESLALMLRPGNAGSNTAADHIDVLTAAIAQVPAEKRKKLLIRADGAGASHALLDWITELDTKRGRSVQYSVGYAVTDKVRDAIAKVPKKAWSVDDLGLDAASSRDLWITSMTGPPEGRPSTTPSSSATTSGSNRVTVAPGEGRLNRPNVEAPSGLGRETTTCLLRG